MGKTGNKSVIYWFLALGYMAFIFYLSSGPSHLPKIPYADKIGHTILYGILGLLVFQAFRASSSEKLARYAWIFTVLICLLYGISDEVHQFFVPHRRVELMDIACDGLGALLAALFSTIKT